MTAFPDMSPEVAFETAPARATIHLDHIVANWRALTRLSKARVGAVVKTDAYGLGMEHVAPALSRAGAKDFFVATVPEGAALRNQLPEADIFVLTGLWDGQERAALENRLIPVAGSLDQLGLILRLKREHPDFRYGLMIETGMNRLGIAAGDAVKLAGDRRFRTVLAPCHLMSHLVASDEPGHWLNRKQRESFEEVGAAFAGVESSLAGSAGIFLGEEFHYEVLRPGLALYGGMSSPRQPQGFMPAVTVEARVLQVKTVRAGETVSYGATHRFHREGRVAVVAAGYGDGWLRSMSGSGVKTRADGSPGAHGVVKGFAVPVVGRITMDLTVFDISAVPEGFVLPGDYIELFGESASLENAARAAGTISYEMLTAIGRRYVKRVRAAHFA